MIRKVHILGASGSGTTTLAKTLAKELGYKHLDTDDFYWISSDVPFTKIRDVEERQSLLKESLEIRQMDFIRISMRVGGYIYPIFRASYLSVGTHRYSNS